jgi:hypothetical protein
VVLQARVPRSVCAFFRSFRFDFVISVISMEENFSELDLDPISSLLYNKG